MDFSKIKLPAAADTRPIGIFDSGMGGVSLLRDALELLPKENFIFYGDNKNAPYGDRSEEEILELTSRAADLLVHQGVKALVLACNTATSASINVLRQKLDVPVVSIEPAIKPACERPGEGKVFMLATVATTKLARYRALQARMPDPDRVINVGISGLVGRVEQGIFGVGEFDDILDSYLSQYHGMTADGVVLGCTHYVFPAEAIETYFKQHFSGECRLYDGNRATVRQLIRVLEANGLVSGRGSGKVEFHTSGDREALLPVFERLLSAPIYGAK
ncbi:MAG: glutamate racemase [Clostridia bacterium]|nr:glutamate racemase [Clostridia bacterium]MBR6006756.1 glutamate racemase [Clostridia bacterium]